MDYPLTKPNRHTFDAFKETLVFWVFYSFLFLYLFFVPGILAYEMHLLFAKRQGLETYEYGNITSISSMCSTNFRN